MSMKTYNVAVRVLLEEDLDEGPVHTLASLILSPLHESGVPVVSILITEGDEL